jgi:hypothetical protein
MVFMVFFDFLRNEVNDRPFNEILRMGRLAVSGVDE